MAWIGGSDFAAMPNSMKPSDSNARSVSGSCMKGVKGHEDKAGFNGMSQGVTSLLAMGSYRRIFTDYLVKCIAITPSLPMYSFLNTSLFHRFGFCLTLIKESWRTVLLVCSGYVRFESSLSRSSGIG